jgi:hypothetical protein
MMLRASSKVNGEDVDLGVVTAGDATTSGVPGETQLLALVEATLQGGSDDDIASARNNLAGKLGVAAMIDAAAVIGNFERMTRIADGTGIPLDDMMAALTVDIRAELDLNSFSSASYTPQVNPFKAALVRLLQPLILRRLRKQFAKSEAA